MKRIGWIDFLRGFSMILILVFHTEVYYKGEEIATPYYVYTTNAIILFYFISGFLLYKDTAFQIKRKLQAIGRYLLLPYFVFTSLLAVPKLLIRNSEINFSEIASNIVHSGPHHSRGVVLPIVMDKSWKRTMVINSSATLLYKLLSITI